MSQTLDAIFCTNADNHGDKIAVTNCTLNKRLTPSSLDSMTYQQMHCYISYASRFFREFNLREGDIVAVQMPSVVELPLILLSIMHAGLVPCLIPSHWRRVELDNAFGNIGPKALIGHSANNAYNPFQTLFEIAAKHTSIRFIFGWGEALFDGITPLPNLQKILANDDNKITKPLHKRTADHAAIIDWSCGEKGKLMPITHTHRTLMANASYFLEQTDILKPSSILTTNSLSNLTGIIAGFVPWLLSGGVLHMAASLEPRIIAEAVKKQTVQIAIIPEFLSSELSSSCLDVGLSSNDIPHFGLVSTPTEKAKQKLSINDKPSFTNLYNLNGYCVFMTPKQTEEEPHLNNITLGQTTNEHGIIIFETRLHGAAQKASDQGEVLSGSLELGGAAAGFGSYSHNMTSVPLPSDEPRWEKTNFKASITNETMNLITIEQDQEGVFYGNTILNGFELDKIYQSFPGFIDAAAFSLKDPLLGNRLFAAIIPKNDELLSYDDFKEHLLAQNISPTKVPEKLVSVTEIPRNDAGIVIRSAILSAA